MTTFDDRERAFESHFALDQEQQFRAVARRNRLLGMWAGELLGKTGEELETYARDVVRSDFKEAGDEDVLQKVAQDLRGRADAAEVRAKMEELLVQARKQIAAEQ